MNGKKTPEEIIGSIAENYENLEKSLVNQLMLETPQHPYTTGSYREQVWKDIFQMIIPKKYCIEQGVFIMDSYGNISKEVDLAVFDEMYTPYIFHYGKIMFIPIEAVSVIIQCKSQLKDDKREDLEEWVESIDGLETSLDAVARIVSGVADNQVVDRGLSQTATRPLKILCATYMSENRKRQMLGKFDFLLHVAQDSIQKDINPEYKNYFMWFSSLNNKMQKDRHSLMPDKRQENWALIESQKERLGKTDYSNIEKRTLDDLCIKKKDEKGKEKENVILSLTFQLNQLLMLINNPMLFPHRAYAQLFQKVMEGE